MRRLPLIVAVALAMAGPALAAVKPSAFGPYWAHQWNALARSEKSPWQIAAIQCKADGEAIYLCYAILRSDAGRALCRDLAIANNGTIVLPPKTVPCEPIA